MDYRQFHTQLRFAQGAFLGGNTIYFKPVASTDCEAFSLSAPKQRFKLVCLLALTCAGQVSYALMLRGDVGSSS